MEADVAAEFDGFSEALISEKLATDQGDGMVYIHGVAERIKFLVKQSESGAKGGKSKAKNAKRNNTSKCKKDIEASAVARATGSALANTLTPDQSLSPDLYQSDAQSDTHGDSRDPLQLANDVLATLNAKGGTKHSPMSGRTLKPILARLRGEENEPAATIAQLELVIDHRCALWLGTDRELYLRPATLFGTEHFADYLQSAERWNDAGRPAQKQRESAQSPGPPEKML